jgi:hypothetical protein
MNGVRVPEKVMQVPEDLLVGTGQEDPQDVGLFAVELV